MVYLLSVSSFTKWGQKRHNRCEETSVRRGWNGQHDTIWLRFRLMTPAGRCRFPYPQKERRIYALAREIAVQYSRTKKLLQTIAMQSPSCASNSNRGWFVSSYPYSHSSPTCGLLVACDVVLRYVTLLYFMISTRTVIFAFFVQPDRAGGDSLTSTTTPSTRQQTSLPSPPGARRWSPLCPGP